MDKNTPIIMYIDDDILNHTAFEASLPSEWRIYTYEDPNLACTMMDMIKPWVIITDHKMPSMTGTEVLKVAMNKQPKAKRLIVTAYSSEETLIEAIREAQPYEFLCKPWEPELLEKSLDRAIFAYLAELEIEKLKEDLLKSKEEHKEEKKKSQYNSEFISNMCYEIRASLQSILGYANLLQETCEEYSDTQAVKSIGNINRESSQLLCLVDNLLDYELINKGNLQILREVVEVTDIVDSIVSALETELTQRNNKLLVKLEPNIQPILADKKRVEQIVVDLLLSVNKFIKSECIKLNILSNEAEVVMVIEGDGIGLDENFDDLGLGLAISKRMAEAMCARITVRPAKIKSAFFELHLPRVVAS